MAPPFQNMLKCGRKLLLCGLLAFPSSAFAHGTESHGDEPAQVPKPANSLRESPTESEQGKPAVLATSSEDNRAHAALQKGVNAGQVLSMETLARDLSFSEFPTLHPMVVHLPVILIPLAFVFALLSLFSAQRLLIWLALGFVSGGLAGGLVAAFPLHPHTTGLPAAANAVLQKHDLFAYGTLWLALVAIVIGLICLCKPGRLPRVCLSLVLLLSTVCVAITAHYGGTLAYVHGVGVQGRYLAPH